MDAIAYGLVLVVLYSDVLSGALRYVASLAGLQVLVYVAPVLALPFTLVYAFVACIRSVKIAQFAAIFVIISLPIVISLLLDRRFEEVVFGLYTLYPLFLGALFAYSGKPFALQRHMKLMWIICVAGVLVNSAISFPWTGGSYEVLGVHVETARQWVTGKTERLPGFSRASFAAANQLLVTSAFILAQPLARSSGLTLLVARGWRVGVWVLSLVGIYLTTAKTPLACEVLLPFMLMGYSALSGVGPQAARPARVYCWAVTLGLILLVVGAPLSLQGGEVSGYAGLRYGFINLSSILDRAYLTWPGVFQLMQDDNNPIVWLVGRGMGGIGSAQYLFDRAHGNPADNLFLFIYASIGLGSVVVFGLLLFRGPAAVAARAASDGKLALSLIYAVLALGLTTTSLESVFPCFAFGLALAMGLSKPPLPSEADLSPRQAVLRASARPRVREALSPVQ